MKKSKAGNLHNHSVTKNQVLPFYASRKSWSEFIRFQKVPVVTALPPFIFKGTVPCMKENRGIKQINAKENVLEVLQVFIQFTKVNLT